MTCNHLRCWMLWLMTWKQAHHCYADFCLSVQTLIDTSIDSRVYHLLSMILQGCKLSYTVDTYYQPRSIVELRYFWAVLSYQYQKKLHNSVHKDSVVQHSDPTKKPSYQQWISKKTERCLMLSHLLLWATEHFSLRSFQHLLLIWLAHMNGIL